MTFMANIRKIIHRSVQLTDFCQDNLTKSKINRCIEKKWLRQWTTQRRDGMCPYGLLSYLEPDHLFLQPIPLHTKRQNLSALCDLLTGQSRLQLFQYRAGLSYSPVCTCLQDEESAYHYLFECKDYRCARTVTQPAVHDWDSVVAFLETTYRLLF